MSNVQEVTVIYLMFGGKCLFDAYKDIDLTDTRRERIWQSIIMILLWLPLTIYLFITDHD